MCSLKRMIIRLFLQLALCQATRCIAIENLPKSGTMMLLVLGANVAANRRHTASCDVPVVFSSLPRTGVLLFWPTSVLHWTATLR